MLLFTKFVIVKVPLNYNHLTFTGIEFNTIHPTVASVCLGYYRNSSLLMFKGKTFQDAT
jgi:hypothetical protein